MKMKNVAVVIIAFCVTQAVWAANMTVYCKWDVPVEVIAFFGSKGSESMTLGGPGGLKKHTFKTGGPAFRSLLWQNQKKCYFASIPSTSVMLFGTVVLMGDEKYAIDFDKDGASSKKLRELEAKACRESL